MSALVIMAAGLGSRFGGTKQLEKVGPHGETFLDYSISDALAVGVDSVVMIARAEIVSDLERHIARRHHHGVDFSFVLQDRFGPPRAKPWGTAHAVLTAAQAVDGSCLVVNADDYYGPSSYRLIADSLAAEPEAAVLPVFELANTLPSLGAVSRGVCQTAGGRLVGVHETHGLRREGTGQIVDADGRPLAESTPVSMNMWGFPAAFMAGLADQWELWHAKNSAAETAEFYLPDAVTSAMADGLLVTAGKTSERWIGVTNPHDLEVARDWLAEVRP